MNPIQQMKFAVLLPPATANDANFSGNTYVDTKGWDHLRVLFVTGTLGSTIGSTDAASTAPLIEECDTTGGTYTAVNGAALADVIAATEDNSLFAIDVDLSGSHKRYMKVQTPDAGAGACYLAILAILSKNSSGDFGGGATESGLTELIAA